MNSNVNKNSSNDLINVPEKLMKVDKIEKNERPILLFNTSPQSKSSLLNITNNKKEKIPIKRKKSNDWNVCESQSNSKMKKISNSLENMTPLILTSRSNASNSSLNSWKTLRDTPRGFNEEYSEFNFFANSIHERTTNSKINREKLKGIKKKRFPNLETGDNKIKFDNLGKTETQRNNKLNHGIKSDKEREVNEKKIFMNVIDILIGVKSILFENRKLVESIQEHFQNCSIFHTIISDDALTLLNEGISR